MNDKNKGSKVIDFDQETLFQAFCKEKHAECLSERRAYGEDPIEYEEYISANRSYLIEEFTNHIRENYGEQPTTNSE